MIDNQKFEIDDLYHGQLLKENELIVFNLL